MILVKPFQFTCLEGYGDNLLLDFSISNKVYSLPDQEEEDSLEFKFLGL